MSKLRKEFEKAWESDFCKDINLSKDSLYKEAALFGAKWAMEKCAKESKTKCPDMNDIEHCNRCHEHITEIISRLANELWEDGKSNG